ncbi:DNA-3-methyladenine glycosylase [Alteromonas mediterranea]|uniref:Putative 3-methyladenine DNA glycosylase n=1 Tax=Alteromonas mediterranea TaxID=314275 RepID=A0AAC9JEX1_9ALTE|nr:DNA-3-methyladenine glycosylase [Alteromonas mediterranea]APD90202.1 3-methyladenine DNA glycosylase [Alteromonas mediterranea]
MSNIPPSFYTDSDVVNVARSLIGNFLFSKIDGVLTGGVIVETEAYCESRDLAMQKHLARRPSSVEALKRQGGVAYIYTVYGYHSMFNIVTNESNYADSVLIRAIAPTIGLETMRERRGLGTSSHNLCSGPAKMSQALALTPVLNGVSLLDKTTVWVEDNAIPISTNQIASSPRIGIDYAEHDAQLPWRFTLDSARK